MADDFTSLSNRLLNRCPAVGIVLSQQLIQDSWRSLQARREWSFRKRSFILAPPAIYQTGAVSTNVANGNPFLLTGIGTTWTSEMVGRQIRAGGLMYPYYTIISYISSTQVLIDQPWAGDDIVGQSYQILQAYFPFPEDFGYFDCAVSLKDSYRMWTNVTQADLAILDPQRTNSGQSYALAFRDFNAQYGGTVGPALPVTNPTGTAPISTTSFGFTYPTNATYVLQVTTAGVSGTAQFKWMRAGDTAFQPAQLTSDQAQDLEDGVQVYWPAGFTYVLNDIFVINCLSQITQSAARYEMWPAPTFAAYLYPVIYYAKEYDLTQAQPKLPPLMANRGEVILEMALEKCATYPGPDSEHVNPYFNLKLGQVHAAKVADLLVDLERNDDEVNLTTLGYQDYPLYASPWMTGSYQQSHAPFLNG